MHALKEIKAATAIRFAQLVDLITHTNSIIKGILYSISRKWKNFTYENLKVPK